MKKLSKAWVQAAIDVTNMEDARALAAMAAEAGAGFIEVGTPLLTFESVRAIEEVVKIAGDIPVVVDFKAQDGVYKYFKRAAEGGAKYAVVLGAMNDGSVKEALRARQDYGIKVIGDMLSVKKEDFVARSRELEALGVDMVYIHFGFDESKYDKVSKPYDGVAEVVEAVNIPVGAGSFGLEDTMESLQRGASWIVMGGPLFVSPSQFKEFKEYVKTVETFRQV